MARLSLKGKRASFTYLELCISLTLIALIFLPLSLSGKKLLRKWQYERDIKELKSQLQLAYNYVLHCNIPVDVVLKTTRKGLICSLNFENKTLEKKCPSRALYPHIKKMALNSLPTPRKKVIFSSAGDYSQPLNFTFFGSKQNQKSSLSLKGYPHVLEIQKNK